MPDDKIMITVNPHPLGYILIPCRFAELCSIELMLHTGRPLSYLSRAAYALLDAFGHIEPADNGRYNVIGLRMGGQLVPDILARVSIGPSLLGFDGLLGLHFLGHFRRIESERDTSLLTLTY